MFSYVKYVAESKSVAKKWGHRTNFRDNPARNDHVIGLLTKKNHQL